MWQRGNECDFIVTTKHEQAKRIARRLANRKCCVELKRQGSRSLIKLFY